MISYCIACYRPRYSTLLIADLIRKTSVPFEILAWLNTESKEFEDFLHARQREGVPVKIVGSTPANIGMAAYPELFAASQYDMVVQIDDDVVCISPHIAETASHIFRQFPAVGMLTADVWQDEYTTGARPEMAHYRVFNAEHGLYDGPIDGWFAIYHRTCLHLARTIPGARYLPLGGTMKHRLAQRRMQGLLCTRMKVFHVIGPQYAHYFGMLDFEIEKYRSLGRTEIVRWYEDARTGLPSMGDLEKRMSAIREDLAIAPI
jgi:hypothetical protein